MRRERDALQLRCNELQEFCHALVTVSERDALILLERLRSGDELDSLLRLAEQMQQGVHEHQSSGQSALRVISEASLAPVNELRAAYFASLGHLGINPADKQTLEPKIEVFPVLPDMRPTRHV